MPTRDQDLIDGLGQVALYLRLLITEPPDRWRIESLVDLPEDSLYGRSLHALILKRYCGDPRGPYCRAIYLGNSLLASGDRLALASVIEHTVSEWLVEANRETGVVVPAKRLPA